MNIILTVGQNAKHAKYLHHRHHSIVGNFIRSFINILRIFDANKALAIVKSQLLYDAAPTPRSRLSDYVQRYHITLVIPTKRTLLLSFYCALTTL